ncbi:hypothetical protein POTOM_053309 [Populus tomentosa]|uniref:Uncharacterized protein n=1 Tax=Populus tomentosa TaxID=118781 RepID=A0A8X7XXW9_POPTO|nr:hypothetical protein POTOM_053309 [Populus tomentosa]
MYREDKFGGGFGVLLLILECGSKSRRLSILQIFGCHIAGLSLLLIERRIEESEPVSYGSNACLRWDAIFSINILSILCAESFAEQTSTPLLDKINAYGTSYNGGDNVVLQQTYSYFDLPGRVFISKILEWTSSVIYYSKPEYLQAKHASDHEVRGSFALIFDPDDMSCCAVLELVSVKEKPYFNSKMKMFSFTLL